MTEKQSRSVEHGTHATSAMPLFNLLEKVYIVFVACALLLGTVIAMYLVYSNGGPR